MTESEIDYLFLTKDVVRIQAETHPNNNASQRVLEKSVFTKDCNIRRGTQRDKQCGAYFAKNGWRREFCP
ncbi:MAG: GNAT family protein [Candidatus Bathyarchaeia archaeon]